MYDDYDIQKFLGSRKEKNLAEILQDTESEIERVKSISVRVKGAVAAREAGSIEYLYALERFYEFMMTNAFHPRTNRNEARLFFSILKHVVSRDELPQTALRVESQIETRPFSV